MSELKTTLINELKVINVNMEKTCKNVRIGTFF